jgi:hypothetical protein
MHWKSGRILFWDRRRDPPIVVGVLFLVVLFAAWTYLAGTPVRAERAKASQLVGPFEFKDQALGSVVERLAGALPSPVPASACEHLANVHVTLATEEPIPVREAFQALALQTGGRFRPFSGQHGERTFLRILCVREFSARPAPPSADATTRSQARTDGASHASPRSSR